MTGRYGRDLQNWKIYKYISGVQKTIYFLRLFLAILITHTIFRNQFIGSGFPSIAIKDSKENLKIRHVNVKLIIK